MCYILLGVLGVFLVMLTQVVKDHFNMLEEIGHFHYHDSLLSSSMILLRDGIFWLVFKVTVA